jgi:glycosyltransferase involved in cell wall biosynthesis
LKSLKIIYYSPHPTHDIVSEVGYSTHQRETIAAMRKLGHEVLPVVMGGTERVAVDGFHDTLKNKSGSASLLKRVIPLFLWNALKDFRLLKHDKLAGQRLEQAILAFNPNLIYERGEYLQDSGVKMAEKYKIPHFLEVNSPVVDEMAAFEGPDMLRFLGHIKERRKLSSTSHVFAISSSMKDYLKNKYKVKVAITVTPNCINPEKDIPSDAEVMELKSTIAPGKQIIGFVGSLFPYHGVDLLIQAHSKVVKDNKNAFLLIIGDGGIRPALQDMAKRILPSDSYLFAGKVPHKEVMKYIGIFDVAVMAASNWYGSPIKIFEYGLMGKAIIAPDNAPVRDAMRPGEDGILVQPDIDQIAIGIHRILKDETMGKQMGQNFKSRILKEFTWEIQAFRILSTLASPVDAG